ncbi:hypothetical protein QFZ29_001310 [Agromyces albus]|nr:hypothetical protein [Agromyces albus]
MQRASAIAIAIVPSEASELLNAAEPEAMSLVRG